MEAVMKNKLVAGAAAAILGLYATSASAWVYDVTVWSGTPNGVQSSLVASSTVPTGTPVATFTFNDPTNGQINWINNAPQNVGPGGNLVSSFLQLADISNFASSTFANVAAFGNMSMSNAGTTLATFFELTTTYQSTTPVAGTISHDDGASVYVNGVPVSTSPGETSITTNNFVLPSGNNNLEIYYVEANGSPSVLTVTAVPEPATWAMMVLGFFGIGFMAYRRRGNQIRFA
jgi:hypothetical protein